MTAPGVSAVIATRGTRPSELRRAIAGVFAQTYRGPIECVVVFDGSQAQDLSDVRPSPGGALRVVSNTRTPGLAGARNSGASAASHAILAFCDDDDEWLAEKISAQLEALEESGLEVALTGIEVAYGDRVTNRVPQADRLTLADLVRDRNAAAHPSTILVLRNAFHGSIGPLDEAIPGSYGEDYEWLLRAARAGSIAVVRRPLVRVHWGGSMFADRWETIADAIAYLLRVHPELQQDRRNFARLQGRLAFAHASLGHRREAARWAWRSIRTRPAERRSYLALAVSTGVVRASSIQERANRAGRGV